MTFLRGINRAVFAALIVVLLNITVGIIYGIDCRITIGKLDYCYEKAIAYTGLGSNGPIAIALGIGGYSLGSRNGWQQGYNTLNPRLRNPSKHD